MKKFILFFFLISKTLCFSQVVDKKNHVNIIDGVYDKSHFHHKKMYYERYENRYTEPDTNSFDGPYKPSKHIVISKSKSMKCLYYTHEKAYYFTFVNDSSTFIFDEDYFWISENEFDLFYTKICDMIEKGYETQRIELKHTPITLRYIDKEVIFYYFNIKKSIYSISKSISIDEIRDILKKIEENN